MIQISLINVYYCIFGFLIGVIPSVIFILKLRKEIKLTKRQYEKKSIGADDSELKIKTLENKIKTLEVALKKSTEE